MKKFYLTAVIILAIKLVLCDTYAKDFYVAQKDPKASDKNTGTMESPWKSIGRALRALRPGDTLYVREGVYREQVVLKREKWRFKHFNFEPFPSGKGIDKPIRFFAYPGEDVWIKGSDLVSGWRRYDDKTWKKDWETNSQQVFCDGVLLRQIAGKMPKILQDNWRGRKGEGLKDMEPGSFYYDIENKKMYIQLKDGSDPNEHKIEISVRPFLFYIGVDYIHVAGFKMTHATSSTWVMWPGCSISGAYNVMENCDVVWTDFSGIYLSGNNNVIRNCRIKHHGNNGMGGRGWGNQVLGCEISHNNYRRWSSNWHAGGMKIIPGAHNWVVSDCLVEHNIASDGIWFDFRNANILIQNCVSRFNDRSGIHYEISERGIIRNNICHDNKGRGIYLSNSSNCIVEHNLCFNNGMSGIACIGIARRGGYGSDPETGYMPARNNIVVGNILIDNCNPKLCPKGKDHTGGTWPQRPELVMPDPSISSNLGCRSDYNIFYRSGERPVSFWENWGAAIYKDIDEWREKTGNEQHSIVAMPKFQDWKNGDYHPAKDSVAIQFVRPQMSITFDKDGKRRPIWDNSYLTAGPYAAPKEFLKAVKAEKGAEAKKVLLLLPGAIALDSIPMEGPLAKAWRDLAARKGELLSENFPFKLETPLKALVLDRENPELVMKVEKRVKELSFLLALLNPGEGVQCRAMISRGDGQTIPLRWENGKNIGPSLGAWDGGLSNKLSPPIKGWTSNEKINYDTQLAWEKGREARFFVTTWKNQNEWLPVKEIELKLENKNATVLVLGLGALSYD